MVLRTIGEGCVAFTRPLEEPLGVQVGERLLKDEYHESVQEIQRDGVMER